MSKPLNTDPFAIWNLPQHADNPLAAHNGIEADSPFKPWNMTFGKIEDLNDEDAATYGIERNTHGDDDHGDKYDQGYGDRDEFRKDAYDEVEDNIF